jgi:uncharacterized membrane protein
MADIDLAMLLVAGATCAAIVLFGVVGARLCRSRELPPRSEVRRHMLCGLYCNPEDPRTIVHRPSGAGWTINVRREACAQLLIVMGVMALVAGAIYVMLSLGSQTDAMKFVAP